LGPNLMEKNLLGVKCQIETYKQSSQDWTSEKKVNREDTVPGGFPGGSQRILERKSSSPERTDLDLRLKEQKGKHIGGTEKKILKSRVQIRGSVTWGRRSTKSKKNNRGKPNKTEKERMGDQIVFDLF